MLQQQSTNDLHGLPVGKGDQAPFHLDLSLTKDETMEMDMKLQIIALGMLVITSGVAQAGSIDVTACDARGGSAAVVIAGAGGDWVGFSARTSSDEIIDAPPAK